MRSERASHVARCSAIHRSACDSVRGTSSQVRTRPTLVERSRCESTSRPRADASSPVFIIRDDRALGFIGRCGVPRKPIWKRVPWYTLLLGVAAALGAVQAIGNHFDWLFAVPSLTMKSDKSRVHLTEASDFAENVGLINELPIAHR